MHVHTHTRTHTHIKWMLAPQPCLEQHWSQSKSHSQSSQVLRPLPLRLSGERSSPSGWSFARRSNSTIANGKLFIPSDYVTSTELSDQNRDLHHTLHQLLSSIADIKLFIPSNYMPWNEFDETIEALITPHMSWSRRLWMLVDVKLFFQVIM